MGSVLESGDAEKSVPTGVVRGIVLVARVGYGSRLDCAVISKTFPKFSHHGVHGYYPVAPD